MSCLQADLLSLPEQRDSRLSPDQLVMWFVKKIRVFTARDQTHLSMIVDSGAELHLVCPAHKHFLTNMTKLSVPLQLETAGGDLTLDVIGDLLCGTIVCHGYVFNPLLSVTLCNAARGEKDGYFYERCPEGYGALKGPRGNVKIERSGGLDYLVRGEGQHVPCFALRSMEVIVMWIMWTWNTCAVDIWSSIRGARRARP